MDAVVFLAPLVVFAYLARESPMGLPYLLTGYAYGLLAIAGVAGEFAPPGARIGPGVAAAARAGLLAALVGYLAMLMVRARLRSRRSAAAGWVAATIVAMLVSAWANPQTSEAISRALLTSVMAVGFFGLLPALANRPYRCGRSDCGRFVYYQALAHGAFVLAVAVALLSAYTQLRYGTFSVGALRLGIPWSPGLLGYTATLALALSVLQHKRPWYVTPVLLTITVASASRMALASAAVVLVWEAVVTRRGSKEQAKRLVALLAVGLVAGAIYTQQVEERLEIRVSPYERSAFDSGRAALWPRMQAAIAQRPWVGHGEQFTVVDPDDDSRAHNLALEIAASYGIPAALFAYLVYLAWGLALWRAPHGMERAALLALLAVAVARTLVTTSSWLNLADGTNVVFLAAVIPLAMALDTQRRDQHQPEPHRARPGLPAV